MGTKRIARAEAVGSLLQPEALLQARAAGDPERLKAEEDKAVESAIELQEAAGLDVISDGEMRRRSWVNTIPFLDGIEVRHGLRSYPTSASVNTEPADWQFVVAPISAKQGATLGAEYPFLKSHAHSRTKYTMAAPSYHRRYWSDELSTEAYESCEAFLTDVRDYVRGVATWLVEQGCDYIQLDAPNYGSLCDPATRAWHESVGHDLAQEIAFDGALDSSVFDGLPEEVTRALHICRGNQPGGTWHSSGGYGALADDLFPALDLDVMLLEYDSDRAGDFSPLSKVKAGQIAVIGLITTKEATLEPRADLEARLAEAAAVKPLAELALSTQCGFASAQNAPMTTGQQQDKLQLVASIAHATWS